MRRYGFPFEGFVVWVETCDMKYFSFLYIYTDASRTALSGPNQDDILSSRSQVHIWTSNFIRT